MTGHVLSQEQNTGPPTIFDYLMRRDLASWVVNHEGPKITWKLLGQFHHVCAWPSHGVENNDRDS